MSKPRPNADIIEASVKNQAFDASSNDGEKRRQGPDHTAPHPFSTAKNQSRTPRYNIHRQGPEICFSNPVPAQAITLHFDALQDIKRSMRQKNKSAFPYAARMLQSIDSGYIFSVVINVRPVLDHMHYNPWLLGASTTLSERLMRSCARQRFVAASSRRTEENVASRKGSGRHCRSASRARALSLNLI